MLRKYLNSITTSNLSSPIITSHSDSPSFSNTITLLLPTFTFCFISLHTSAKHFTNSVISSLELASSTVSSAYNKCDTFHLSLPYNSSTPFSSLLRLTSFIVASINKLNSQVDITQPCPNPTFTSNQSLRISSDFTQALLPL